MVLVLQQWAASSVRYALFSPGAKPLFTLTLHLVLYRSKDSTLPDFSKENGPGGEVFFDVSRHYVDLIRPFPTELCAAQPVVHGWHSLASYRRVLPR